MHSLETIPFTRTFLTGREMTYIESTVASNKLSGPGQQSAECETLIRAQVGAVWSALVPSCTAALEMSALLLDLQSGDEVILPSYTFVSTANAIVLRGAVPVFVDVEADTLNLSPEAVEAAITPKTKAIFVVHYAGVIADMMSICAIARRHGISVVEDAAQAFGSTRFGSAAGSFGRTACFSFHGTKNISAGEGGALVVNDPTLTERASIIREKGTDRSLFLRGLVSAYGWQDIGSSQIVSEVTAAFLRAQLENGAAINHERVTLWQNYHDAFSEAEAEGCFLRPHPPEDAVHNGHIYFIILPDRAARQDLAKSLSAAGIMTATHYVPLHSAPAGLRFGRVSGDMSVTDNAAECMLRLPIWNGLGLKQDRVIEAVLSWCAMRRNA